MKNILLALLTTLLFAMGGDFVSDQRQFPRVRQAYAEKGDSLKRYMDSLGIPFHKMNILLTAYKAERVVELYAKRPEDAQYKKIRAFRICASSGVLGPKREQGDMQVPEGFYHLSQFNPASNFWLSLKVSYPNQSDRLKSKASRLGGDIYIHGSCATIGCLPMTDDKIKELYIYAVQATNCGQSKIPVYIFPYRLNEVNFPYFAEQYKHDSTLVAFWANLKQGYDVFHTDFKELKVRVDKDGNYLF
jgi:murein L,D-transpeptidase YafK